MYLMFSIVKSKSGYANCYCTKVIIFPVMSNGCKEDLIFITKQKESRFEHKSNKNNTFLQTYIEKLKMKQLKC